jgi:hypothetical protein
MKTIEIEVMCQHYMGALLIEPVYEDFSLFSVYHKHEFLGHIQPVKKLYTVKWYSHEITDKELVAQAGEWAAYHFPLTEKSFKRIYEFSFFKEFMTGLLAIVFARFS